MSSSRSSRIVRAGGIALAIAVGLGYWVSASRAPDPPHVERPTVVPPEPAKPKERRRIDVPRPIPPPPAIASAERPAPAPSSSGRGPAPRNAAELFPDTVAGQRLREHWRAVMTPAEHLADAERAEAETLAEVRKHAAESVQILRDTYDELGEHPYNQRWAVVVTLGRLATPESYEPLQEIALSQIPAEQSSDLHHYSTQGEEAMIRMAAVEGLSTLARTGNTRAEADLLGIAQSAAPPSVRVMAIQGYVAAGPDTDARRESVKSKVDESLQWAATESATSAAELDAELARLGHD